jgi:hypothetical protein
LNDLSEAALDQESPDASSQRAANQRLFLALGMGLSAIGLPQEGWLEKYQERHLFSGGP